MGIISLSELEQYLWSASNILRGPIDKADFKAYIIPLLFFKRLSDVYDEQSSSLITSYFEDRKSLLFADQKQFVIPDGCQWKNISKTTQDIGKSIQYAYNKIETANPSSLLGIFGDVTWTNKDRIPDEILHALIAHFTSKNLSNSNVSPDVLGQAYEFLIKKFADLDKNKAGEFYTPREVVQLIISMLKPRERESVYDPACGSGGMLLEAFSYVKNNRGDCSTLNLFGQEKNLTTSSIARINLLLHGVMNFKIERGDTLRHPAFAEDGQLKKFDIVIANPPYSMKNWGYEHWLTDPFERNFIEMPPKSNGDYAWIQHMIISMSRDNGRVGVVLPTGILFRGGTEKAIRKHIIEADILECVIGLGQNLFYGTALSACILLFRSKKVSRKQNNVFFIDASNLYQKGRSQNFLLSKHVKIILDLYEKYYSVDNLSTVASVMEIRDNDYNLNIPNYVKKQKDFHHTDLIDYTRDVENSYNGFIQSEERLTSLFKEMGII